MFDKILIANRGEIACRIIRTARALGVRTVAVYSDADAGARHVMMADEAWHIGPSPARDSYLCGDKIIEVARRSSAQAIHPGYGFLAENPQFAEACTAAGFTFIGPPVAAIEAMGSKSAAKEIMARAGVPLVPGYHGAAQEPARLQTEAERIGFPLLIKASAGGGGKGMRVVTDSAEFPAALSAAQREAASAFGDDRVLLEKYLARPRHVELQIFADSHGHCLHLFERDCSIQRRHQKVVEEAPAPGMSNELREKMGASAIAAAKAIGYIGAGTVEFLLDAKNAFYFMEMNTRLQVEHPVTEMISGQDLVAWQLRVAAGEPLPCRQRDLTINGHAIEARIYAEDPTRDFLPSIGRLHHLRTPVVSPQVRVDSGVREGDEVSLHYDPMIAKLIVHGADRAAALRALRHALADFQVVGVATNLAFLQAVARHPAFGVDAVDTGFIEEHRPELLPAARSADDHVLALASLGILLRRDREARHQAAASSDPWSPWNHTDGWRLNGDNHHELRFEDEGTEVRVIAHFRPSGYQLDLPGGTLQVHGELDAASDLLADLGGRRLRATVVQRGERLHVQSGDIRHSLGMIDPYLHAAEQDETGARITTPMPGKVIAVLVDDGAKVKKGEPLMILEAMKMEHSICAPCDGTVTQVHFAVGAQVGDGAELLDFEADTGG